MIVSEYITEELIKLGVKHVFTLAGGFSQYLNDSIGHSKITPIYMLHESGASFAAAAYAQYTGGLGVCVITSGPGVTNALTGVASAWDDNLPVLVISGEAKVLNIAQRTNFKLRQGGPQDVDTVAMVRPIVKYIETIFHPANTKQILEEAVNACLEGRRGPAWIVIPLDVQGMEI
jgi:acetolactate synthase-1/2/3 large subunit